MTSSKSKPYDYSITLDDSWADPGWFRMSNAITRDQSLSTEAVGAVTRMVDNDENFTFNKEFLQKKLGWGRDKTARYLKELELAGYLVRERERDEHGQFSKDTRFRLFPRPCPDAIEKARALYGKKTNVSAGKLQRTENQGAGRNQGKHDVSAGKLQRTENQGAGVTREKDGVSAGKLQRTENQGLDIRNKQRTKQTNTKNTHTAPEATHSPEVVEAEGVCVDELFDSTGATDQVLQTVAIEARSLLSQADRGQIDAAVRECVKAGHSVSAITKRVTGRTNARTCAPRAVLVSALKELQSEPPAASHTSGTPGASSGASVDSKCIACGTRVKDDSTRKPVLCSDCIAAGYADFYATEVAS